MVNKVYSNRISEYAHENGGRVILLFLLFCLAIYSLSTSGLSSFALICILPIFIPIIYAAFKWRMFTFWTLILINYFIQMKDISLPIPMSLPNEILEILLLCIALIDTRNVTNFERCGNIMLFAIILWISFCCIEVLNDTCGLGIDIISWFTGARLMAFQLLWIFLVFSIYISSPKVLYTYIVIWAFLSLFSAFWTWKQTTLGFTPAENYWIETRGRSTHIINAGTLIRYFSTFSDAASYGCHAAGAAVAFIIISITTKIKKERYFFSIVAIAVIWGMFQSGTRTATITLAAGLLTYVFLSKSFKIAVPFSIIFSILAFILVFTKIGDGNQQIRRMRSAFDKEDASANVRDVNKEAIRKYIKDAPWGIGIGMSGSNIPANNKYKKLSTIPPDSEYVFIWVHTGPIGITVFLLCMTLMWCGACRIVLFKLKNQALVGVGAAFCCAFVSIQLGGYANQILYQYPNGLTFFGGLAIVYLLPYMEKDWIKYEQEQLGKQEEKKRLKLEKKLAKRV